MSIKTRTIRVIGAGGIGSYLCRHLAKLKENNQLVGREGQSYDIHVYDDDEVEHNNVLYQDFLAEDVFMYKVTALSDKYGLIGTSDRVSSDDIEEWPEDDIIACCVDNASTRRMLFEEFADRQWVDLRCQGRNIVTFACNPKTKKQELLDSLPEEENEETENGSCQRADELSAGIIQQGNVIVSAIGSQWILNMLRGDYVPVCYNKLF